MVPLSTDFLRRRAELVRAYRKRANQIRRVRLRHALSNWDFGYGNYFRYGNFSEDIRERVTKLDKDFAYAARNDPVIYAHLCAESRCLDNVVLLSDELRRWNITLSHCRTESIHYIPLSDEFKYLRFVRKTSSRLEFWEAQLALTQKKIEHARAGF